MAIVGVWIALLLAYGYSLGVNCLEVKEEYENNRQLASEKYGFESFEEWTKENKMWDNCFPGNQGGGYT